jgi:hypothetical protein
MPAEATEIIFDWNFFSEEFIEYCGAVYQDTFTVSLTDPMDPGNTVTLFQIMIDDLCGPPSFVGDDIVYKNPKVFPVSVSFDQGDVWATGWKSHVATIPTSLTDKVVELTFSCSDVGDSIYDTAILIDHIELIGVEP